MRDPFLQGLAGELGNGLAFSGGDGSGALTQGCGARNAICGEVAVPDTVLARCLHLGQLRIRGPTNYARALIGRAGVPTTAPAATGARLGAGPSLTDNGQALSG